MKVTLYVEGGGDKSVDIACRAGFRKLLTSAGFKGRMPRIKACGARHGAYKDFNTALRYPGTTGCAILLVDSEGPVADGGWIHLQQRDGWARPHDAEDDQAQLMVQCMETWCIADRSALWGYFGDQLQQSALPRADDLEAVAKDDIQRALENATRPCGRSRQYRKGRRSYELLGRIDARKIKKLRHFDRLCRVLEARLHDPEVTR